MTIQEYIDKYNALSEGDMTKEALEVTLTTDLMTDFRKYIQDMRITTSAELLYAIKLFNERGNIIRRGLKRRLLFSDFFEETYYTFVNVSMDEEEHKDDSV